MVQVLLRSELAKIVVAIGVVVGRTQRLAEMRDLVKQCGAAVAVVAPSRMGLGVVKVYGAKDHVGVSGHGIGKDARTTGVVDVCAVESRVAALDLIAHISHLVESAGHVDFGLCSGRLEVLNHLGVGNVVLKGKIYSGLRIHGTQQHGAEDKGSPVAGAITLKVRTLVDCWLLMERGAGVELAGLGAVDVNVEGIGREADRADEVLPAGTCI